MMMTEQSEFCWRCQEKSSILGHVTKNCPLIQCKKCFKFGHIISNCLSKIKLEKEQDLFKIKATNSSTGQKIPALLQNQHFTALFILENVPSHIKRVHITPSKIGHAQMHEQRERTKMCSGSSSCCHGEMLSQNANA
jgi:desulfoferrodoxin (superoxide reductase-like protein)